MSTPATHPSQDVLGVLGAQPQFSVFRAAIARAGLSCAFRTLDRVTVFAPTDAAFDRLASRVRAELFDDDDVRRLAALLWYHVAAGTRSLHDMGGYIGANTALGQSVLLSRVCGAVRVDGALVVMPDLTASNGVVHGIDKVNFPRPSMTGPDPQAGVPRLVDGGLPDWKRAPWVMQRMNPSPRYGRRSDR